MPDPLPPHHDRVTLRRAERATDFWVVLEAAQYARIASAEPGLRPEAAEAAAAFIGAFEEHAGAWEEQSTAAQQAVLERLAAAAKALAAAELSVYVGTLERNFAPRTSAPALMPIALLHVGPAGAESATIDLPHAMRIERG